MRAALLIVTAIMTMIVGAFVMTARGGDPAVPTFQGWVEANLLFIGPDESGRIDRLAVREGDKVSLGSGLFTVDSDRHKATVHQNETVLANAQQTFDRALVRSASGSRRELDAAREALVEAETRYASSRARLAHGSVLSPADGTIQRVYYRPGEVVAMGRPVVSLLPSGNVKLRFFLPQAMLPQIKLGDEVRARCDGCEAPISAEISFISQTPEYTPPVIYSLEERARLVFLVEARPHQPDKVRVGQPVRVVLEKGSAIP